MAFTQTWDDAFEDIPADGDQIKFGADKIRDGKEGIRERVQIDHEMGTADGAGTDTGVDTGYHKKVTVKVAVPGTAPAGYVIMGAATNVLRYKGEDGTLRTVVNTDEAQSFTYKTLNGASNVLNSVDINSPDIDEGTINGTTIAASPISGSTGSFTTLGSSGLATLASITTAAATITGGSISATPISGSTGSFTTLAASALASLSGGLTTGLGSIAFKTYLINQEVASGSLAVSITHGITNGEANSILGGIWHATNTTSVPATTDEQGTITFNGALATFTVPGPGAFHRTYANAIIFYKV